MTTANFIQDEQEFDSLLSTESVLVIDCTATWCGPCKLVAPLMDQLASEYSGKAKIFKLDLDRNKLVAQRFKVKSIPAVLFFLEGELVETLVGVKPYAEFSTTLTKILPVNH